MGDRPDPCPCGTCRISASSLQTVFSSPNSLVTEISLKPRQLKFLWSGKCLVWLSSPESEHFLSESFTEWEEFAKELIKHILWGWKNTISSDSHMARPVQANDIQIRNPEDFYIVQASQLSYTLGEIPSGGHWSKQKLKGLKTWERMKML